jgi:DNA-binding FrmR family transcriptional regulator
LGAGGASSAAEIVAWQKLLQSFVSSSFPRIERDGMCDFACLFEWISRRGILYHTPVGYAQDKLRSKKKKQEQKMPDKVQDKVQGMAKEKQKLLFRIKRIRGQFAAVERALTAGDECADILMLLAAIRGGVNGLMAEILEDHIRLHMMNPEREMDSPEELGEDLIGLVRAYLK